MVGGGPLGLGSVLRYVVKLPIGRSTELRLVVRHYEELVRCSGTLDGPSMSGTWSWRYRSREARTTVFYETAVTLSGILRFAGRLVEDQVAADVRRNLDALKAYVEAGRVSTR